MAGKDRKLTQEALKALVDKGIISPADAGLEMGDRMGPDPNYVDVGPARITSVGQPAPEVTVGDARLAHPIDNLPPRTDMAPPAEPSTPPYEKGSAPVLGPFTSGAMPRGAGNQYAAVLNGGLPPGNALDVGGRPPPSPELASGAGGNNLAAPPAPLTTPPPNPGAAIASEFAAIDPNQPNIHRNTSTTTGYSQVIEGDAHKRAAAATDAARAAQNAVYDQQKQHAREAGQLQAEQIQSTIDQLAKGNARHQQAQEARMAQVEEAAQARQKLSADFEQEAKGAPLGSVLNPDAARVVGSAIAQALGAFGANMSHGQNAALAILNTQLDSALKQRAQTLEAKRTAVTMADRHFYELRTIFKDKEAAHLAWKADVMDEAGRRAEKLAALTGAQDKIDAADQFKAAAGVRAAEMREQASERLDKHIQSQTTNSTQVSTGPQAAIANLKAKYDAINAAKGGNITIPPETVLGTAKQKMYLDEVERSIQSNNFPDIIKRVNAGYGADISGWDKAAAAGFAAANLTPQEKDAIGAMYGLLNARILAQTGKAMNQAEAPRVKAEIGFADFNSPADVMRGLRRVGRDVSGAMAAITTANPRYGEMFVNHAAASVAPPDYGTVAGTTP